MPLPAPELSFCHYCLVHPLCQHKKTLFFLMLFELIFSRKRWQITVWIWPQQCGLKLQQLQQGSLASLSSSSKKRSPDPLIFAAGDSWSFNQPSHYLPLPFHQCCSVCARVCVHVCVRVCLRVHTKEAVLVLTKKLVLQKRSETLSLTREASWKSLDLWVYQDNSPEHQTHTHTNTHPVGLKLIRKFL